MITNEKWVTFVDDRLKSVVDIINKGLLTKEQKYALARQLFYQLFPKTETFPDITVNVDFEVVYRDENNQIEILPCIMTSREKDIIAVKRGDLTCSINEFEGTWEDLKEKAASMGMRLPTVAELDEFFKFGTAIANMLNTLRWYGIRATNQMCHDYVSCEGYQPKESWRRERVYTINPMWLYTKSETTKDNPYTSALFVLA